MRSITLALSALALLGTSSLVSAQRPTAIFVAGYDGHVRTVNLANKDGKYTLSEVNKTDGCKTNPTWLSLDFGAQRLWCLDEGWVTGNGTLNSFDVEDGGSLVHTQRRNVSASPVQTKFLAGGSQLAIAQYGGPANSSIRGGLTIHKVKADGTLSCSTNYTFEALEQPGPKPGQDVPRAHGVVTDPTGKWLVVPDYGADKIRTFRITENRTVIKGVEMETPPGSAPRHAQFAKLGESTYLFVLAENANTIATYEVTYVKYVLHLSTPKRVIDTFGGKATAEVLQKAKAAEIQITPDKQFLMVSNRLDKSFPDSDSISTYRINADGSLTFVQLAPVGGLAPRHFTLNKAGDMVLVSLTASSKIAVLKRDPVTGKIGETLASLAINTTTVAGGEPAGIPAAIWYE